MSDEGYWAGVQRLRMSRRRALGWTAAAGGTALALSLVGCGGGSKSNGGTQATQEPASGMSPLQRKDTTSQAKPGGVFAHYTPTDVTNLDPIAATANIDRTEAAYVYNKLFHFKVGVVQAATGQVEGELADSYEISSDNMQITIKLKPNVLWDQRPPTSSRKLDSSDVAFSFQKFHDQSVYSASWFNDKNPANYFLTNWSTPDPQTFVLKLAKPLGAMFDFLGDLYSVPIMPKESDGGFDPRRDSRGTNAWMLDSWKPSQGFEYKRNPNFFIKDRPFFDGWSRPIVTEYAAALAQFKTGGIWMDVVQAQDIIQTKKDLPQLLLLQGEYGAPAQGIFFGWNSAPFKDQRVRQAMSRLIDRESIATVFSSNDDYVKEGIDIGIVYDNFLGKGWGDYWIDPFGKDAGDGAVNYKHDVASAKQLLSAAGYANGFNTTFYGPKGAPYGTNYDKWAQTLGGMFQDAGIKVDYQSLDYSGDYVPSYNYGQAFDGWSIFVNTLYGGVANNLRTNFHSASVQDRTLTAPTHARPTPKPAAGPQDTKLDGMIDQLLQSTDLNKSVSTAQDIQRYLSQQMYAIPYYYKAQALSLAQPWVGNYGAYRPWPVSWVQTDVYPNLWYDASKK